MNRPCFFTRPVLLGTDTRKLGRRHLPTFWHQIKGGIIRMGVSILLNCINCINCINWGHFNNVGGQYSKLLQLVDINYCNCVSIRQIVYFDFL